MLLLQQQKVIPTKFIRNVKLDNKLVWNRGNNFGFFSECFDSVCFSWLSINTFHIDVAAGFFCLFDCLVVNLDTIEESLSGARMFNVLNTDIDSFRDNSTVVLHL